MSNFSDYQNLLGVKAGAFGQVDPEKLQEADDKIEALTARIETLEGGE